MILQLKNLPECFSCIYLCSWLAHAPGHGLWSATEKLHHSWSY